MADQSAGPPEPQNPFARDGDEKTGATSTTSTKTPSVNDDGDQNDGGSATPVPQNPFARDGNKKADPTSTTSTKTPSVNDDGDQNNGGSATPVPQNPFARDGDEKAGTTSTNDTKTPSVNDGGVQSDSDITDSEDSTQDPENPLVKKNKKKKDEFELHPKGGRSLFVQQYPGLWEQRPRPVPITDPIELKADLRRERKMPAELRPDLEQGRKDGTAPKLGFKFLWDDYLHDDWRNWRVTFNPFDALGMQPELLFGWKESYSWDEVHADDAHNPPLVADIDMLVTKAFRAAFLHVYPDIVKGKPLYPYNAEERKGDIKVDIKRVEEGFTFFPYDPRDVSRAKDELLDEEQRKYWVEVFSKRGKDHISTWNPTAKRGTKGVYYPLPAYDVPRPDSDQRGIPDIIPRGVRAPITLKEMMEARLKYTADAGKRFDPSSYGAATRQAKKTETKQSGVNEPDSTKPERRKGSKFNGLGSSDHAPRSFRGGQQQHRGAGVDTDRTGSQREPVANPEKSSDRTRRETPPETYPLGSKGPSEVMLDCMEAVTVLDSLPYALNNPSLQSSAFLDVGWD